MKSDTATRSLPAGGKAGTHEREAGNLVKRVSRSSGSAGVGEIDESPER